MNMLGAMEMLGRAIRLAIDDYREVAKDSHILKAVERLHKLRKKSNRNFSDRNSSMLNKLNAKLRNYESAKNWIYNPNKLEALLNNSNLNEILSIDAIRYECEK